jgi:hypothetical protein
MDLYFKPLLLMNFKEINSKYLSKINYTSWKIKIMKKCKSRNKLKLNIQAGLGWSITLAFRASGKSS